MANKKNKKSSKMTRKICFLGGTTLALLILCAILIMGGFNLTSVNANPDYICIKDVKNEPCEITACGVRRGSNDPSKAGGYRVCVGRKTTQTAYYTRRTTCAEGYSQRKVGESGGSSGTTRVVPVYSSTACQILEWDEMSPFGEVGEGVEFVKSVEETPFDTKPVGMENATNIPTFKITVNNRPQYQKAPALYLCVQNKSSNECKIPVGIDEGTGTRFEQCGPTQANGKRVCVGERTVRTAYYSLGTPCASGEQQNLVGYRSTIATTERVCTGSKSNKTCGNITKYTYRLVDFTGRNYVLPTIPSHYTVSQPNIYDYSYSSNYNNMYGGIYNSYAPATTGNIRAEATGVIYNVPNYIVEPCEIEK